jgi:hypothetical protein
MELSELGILFNVLIKLLSRTVLDPIRISMILYLLYRSRGKGNKKKEKNK